MAPTRHNAAEMERIIAQRVADGIAAYEANRASGSGTDRGSETRVGSETTIRPCSYKDFLNCKPTDFKGTEGAVGLLRWFERMESVFRISNCAENCKVKYSTCTLQDSALTWWNSHAQSMGIDAAYELLWEDLKRMMTAEYCPRNEVQKLEAEFWDLKVKGTDVAKYTNRFLELALLCPTFVTPEYKKIERYIWGLSPQIQGNVTASKPDTIQSAIRMAHDLMDQVVRNEASEKSEEVRTYSGKRKAHDFEFITPATPINQVAPTGQSNKKAYGGNQPLCNTCKYHHSPNIPCLLCTNCGRYGHLSTTCRLKPQANQPRHNNQPAIAPPRQIAANGLACFECGDPNHFRKQCPKLTIDNQDARGRAYNLNAIEAQGDNDVA